MNLPVSFGLWLTERRKQLGLTWAGLAGCVGCATVTIRKIEADERRPSRQLTELSANCLYISAEQHPLFLQIARGERRIARLKTASPTLASFHCDL